MSFFAAAGFTVFILILFTGIFLNLFGLPGTVVIFLDVLLYSIFTGFEHTGLKIILFLFISSVIAETIEFFWIISEAPQQAVSQKKSFKAAAIRSFCGNFFAYTVLGWTGYMDRIFFRRSCRSLNNRNFKASQIKSSSPNA